MIANAKKISMAVLRRGAGSQQNKKTLIDTKDWFKPPPAAKTEKEVATPKVEVPKIETESKEPKRPALLFAQKPKASTGFKSETSRYEDDVHSARFKMLTENRQFSSEDEKKKAHTFYFNRSEEKTIPVYLDDINIINIDNEETFHRVPKLAHKLDVVV